MFEIIEPREPELMRKTFPGDRVPVLSFSEKSIPQAIPKDAWLTETIHRDGQQGQRPFSAEESKQIYDILGRITGDSGLIRQAEFFVYSSADKEALEYCLGQYNAGKNPIEPTAWIRASASDVKLIRDLGIKETGMLASASDYHTFFKFKPGGRNQAAEKYLEAEQLALDYGIRPRLHLEDATRASMKGFILPFIEAACKKAESYGDELKPKFRICDTMGLGLPWPEAPLPRGIPRIFHEIRTDLDLETEQFEFHTHNDTGLVIANSLAAILYGCGAVNGAILGRGERTGNSPTEIMLFHLMGMYDKQADLKAVNEMVELFKKMEMPIPPKHPLYGSDAHKTRAGIHVDGIIKHPEMYSICDTGHVFCRPLDVVLTSLSGLAGILFMIRQRFPDARLDKHDPGIVKVFGWVNDQYEAGRVTGIDWDELEPLIRQHLPHLFGEEKTREENKTEGPGDEPH